MNNLKINPTVYTNWIDDEFYAIDTLTEMIIHLNTIGFTIWDYLNLSKSEDEIVSKISSLFPMIDTEQISLDVKLFIKRLVKKGFLIQV